MQGRESWDGGERGRGEPGDGGCREIGARAPSRPWNCMNQGGAWRSAETQKAAIRVEQKAKMRGRRGMLDPRCSRLLRFPMETPLPCRSPDAFPNGRWPPFASCLDESLARLGDRNEFNPPPLAIPNEESRSFLSFVRGCDRFSTMNSGVELNEEKKGRREKCSRSKSRLVIVTRKGRGEMDVILDSSH